MNELQSLIQQINKRSQEMSQTDFQSRSGIINFENQLTSVEADCAALRRQLRKVKSHVFSLKPTSV